MDIGERIAFFRTKKGITVNKLANISGISQSYLRDIELGNKQPTVEYLSYICDGLGISLATFFSESSETNEFSSVIDSLTEKQKNTLKEFIKSLTE